MFYFNTAVTENIILMADDLLKNGLPFRVSLTKLYAPSITFRDKVKFEAAKAEIEVILWKDSVGVE